MATLLENYRDAYMNAMMHLEKKCIATFIVRTIEGNGGRFLVRMDDGWQRVDDDTARDKVSQAIRMRERREARDRKSEEC